MGRVEADNRAGVEAGSSDLDKDLRRAVGIVEIHADLVGALGGEAVDKERGGGEVLTPTAGDATHSRRRAHDMAVVRLKTIRGPKRFKLGLHGV